MGELHLDIYIERMKREYACEVIAGKPQVAYREAITQRAEFNYTHKKQTGGSGQYGKVGGLHRAAARRAPDRLTSSWTTSRRRRSRASSSRACDKGFREAIKKGPLIGFPIVGVRCVINDGASHAVDSSEIAFRTAALMGFREAYANAKPTILEPIMKVEVEVPRGVPGRGRGSGSTSAAASSSRRRSRRASSRRWPRCR